MTYSDLYLTRTTKIEILPSDKLEQRENFFVEGDKLIAVFRPVRTPAFADSLSKFFFDELYSWHTDNQLPISEAMKTAIHTSNVGQLNFLGDPEYAPESGAMVLIAYLDPHNQFTIAQVGDITLKQRQNGRFTALTEDHTFDNPSEVDRLATFLRNSGTTASAESVITDIATSEGFTEKIPSRFIGHPDWCGWGGEYGETIVNTTPAIIPITLESRISD